MKNKRDVLIIDDEMVIAQGVLKVCLAEGVSVDMAEHAAGGLDLLARRSYRLIICDIAMERMDGFQFLEEAARLGIRTPVIMATGYSTVENAVRSLSCGALDFIAKPFTSDELMAVVRRGLKFSGLQEAAASSAPAGGRALPEHMPCPPGYRGLGYVSWAAPERAGTVLVGVSDLFLKTIEGVRSLELSAAGGEAVQGNTCAAITSGDALTHGVMCPVSGKILEVNSRAAADPGLVIRDPYAAGWFYRILPSDLERDLRRLEARPPGRV